MEAQRQGWFRERRMKEDTVDERNIGDGKEGWGEGE